MALAQALKVRHINMIAIGGSIGTGIFLASGYTIFVGGPGGALLSYALMAVVVYFLMTSLAEMSAYQPTAGTFCEYASHYVGPSFGAAVGYNYWLNWALTIAAEISAAALIMGYWFPDIPSIFFSLLFFCSILICNIISVRFFGEIEYVMSFVKLSMIVIFIVLGSVLVFKKPHFGLNYWVQGDAPFHQGWYGFISVFLFAGFSFQGTELVGVASAEAQNPAVSIPQSIKYVFWRLALFYILSIFIITLLVPYNDPHLTFQDNVSMSPYTMVFAQYISHYAGDVVNFVILIAVLSAANASMYSSTRILWYLGKTNQAPAVFSRVNYFSIPLPALCLSALVGALVFLSSFVGNGLLFSYLIQISSLSGFMAWFAIALSHYRFRKRIMAEKGNAFILPYRAKFYPFAQYIAMAVMIFVIGAQCLPIFWQSTHKLVDLLVTYSSIILFFVFYFVHKYLNRA